MSSLNAPVLALALICCIWPVFASTNKDLAPPTFSVGGNPAVAVDFKSVTLYLSLDPAGSSRGRAVVDFEALDTGFPIFDLVPQILSLKLNGTQLSPADAAEVSAPDQATRFRVLKSAVGAGSSNILDIEFAVNYGDISNGRARIAFLMSDLGSSGREFWEQYGPSNYEFDQFAMTVFMEVKNSQTTHDVFSNGAITEVQNNSWKIEFPDYFTTSSFFLHISERGRFKIENGSYDGQLKRIPIVAYATKADLAQRAVANAIRTMSELEATYGPYAHDKLVLYMTETGGGMEHIGAAVTSLWALEHEITHSWFARGVMPANGNAGWIDEAIASWRDDGYQRATAIPNRSPVNLGGFSAYRRHTTQDAYTLGKKLIGEFDWMFRDVRGPNSSGMRYILSQFYQQFARRTISVEMFKSFIENMTGRNTDDIFNRYVYGRSFKGESPEYKKWPEALPASKHPRPFTAEERQLLH